MSATTSAYDEVAFPSYPFPLSHSDRLAVAGRKVGKTDRLDTANRINKLFFHASRVGDSDWDGVGHRESY